LKSFEDGAISFLYEKVEAKVESSDISNRKIGEDGTAALESNIDVAIKLKFKKCKKCLIWLLHNKKCHSCRHVHFNDTIQVFIIDNLKLKFDQQTFNALILFSKAFLNLLAIEHNFRSSYVGKFS
jgi:hypothetical protein